MNMNPFVIRPQIKYFSTITEFATDEDIGAGDLIILEGFIRDRYPHVFSSGAAIIDISKFCKGEPTDTAVLMIRNAMGPMYFSRVIAIGGGTVLDIAKILSLENGDKLDNLLSKTAVPKRSAKLVLIPTTCGTGSEMTNISIVDFTKHNVKMGITGDALYADQAVIIPELLKGIPQRVFAASSIDALIHASESFVSPKANWYTRMFSTKAINMILNGYKEYLRNGKALTDELNECFLLASNYAGIAFGNAGCGAVHAMSYPLGAGYHVPHGESNYVFFTEVFKKYHELNCSGALVEWEKIIAAALETDVEKVYEKMAELLDSIIQKKKMSEYGVKEEEIEVYTDTVISSQKRLMDNNFVPLERPVVYEIYKSVY